MQEKKYHDAKRAVEDSLHWIKKSALDSSKLKNSRQDILKTLGYIDEKLNGLYLLICYFLSQIMGNIYFLKRFKGIILVLLTLK